MPELKAIESGWRTEGGRRLLDQPIQWQVFVEGKEHLIWKIDSVFTVDGGRDGRTEFESLDAAVRSLR